MSAVKYARSLSISCLYPIVGCSLYAAAVLRAGGTWIELFPIPVVLLVVALGFRYTKNQNSGESLSKYVQGNVILGVIFTLGSIALHWLKPYIGKH